MSILVRRDPDTGYAKVDFFVDQLVWRETVVKHESTADSAVIDVSGWVARLSVRSTRGVLVLELSGDDFEVDGPAGAFTWETSLAGLSEPVYDYDLVLTPADPDVAPFTEFQGRLVIRQFVDAGVPSS